MWQNSDGLSYAMSRRSSVQCNLSCPPRYVISTKQAINKVEDMYTVYSKTNSGQPAKYFGQKVVSAMWCTVVVTYV